MLIKYKNPILIDFGSAQIISSQKKLSKNIEDLGTTPGFTSPEITLYKAVLDDIHERADMDYLCDICPSKKNKLATYKCFKCNVFLCDNHISRHKKKKCNVIKISTYIDKLKENITYNDINKTLKNNFFLGSSNNKSVGSVIFDIIWDNNNQTEISEKIYNYYKSFENKEFTNHFLKKIRTEFIYKIDIFSLGRVFQYIYDLLKIRSKHILGLINHMTELNHEKRFSIEDCINYMDDG